jgi:phospholipid/cholesterol/gamma-HCH transport system substrate-binding protein
MIRRLALILGGSLLIALLGAGVYFSIKAAYGGYRDSYYVSARLPRAGQQVQIGTDVRVRGVIVGKVSGIALEDRSAVLTLEIGSQHEIPETAEMVVSLKTLLGSKFVDLRFDPRTRSEPLADGDVIEQADVGPELEDALDDGTRLLDVLDAQEVAQIVHELARAGRGHGDDIARGLEAQAKLSTTFAQTRTSQIESLRDFDRLFESLDEVGDELNELAAATNEGVPVFASEQAQRDMAEALDEVVPFADHLSDILLVERENLDRMYVTGDKVLGTIAANSRGLANLLHGAYRYVFRLGTPIRPTVLFDGTASAGFTNFIGGNDQEEEFRQICSAFPEEERDEVPFCEEDGP